MTIIQNEKMKDGWRIKLRAGMNTHRVGQKRHCHLPSQKGPASKQKKWTFKHSQHGESVKLHGSQSWIYIVIVALKSHVHASRVYSKFDPHSTKFKPFEVARGYSKFDPYTFYKIQAV
ncbi:hypothetical protein BU17DRAFT_65046 [Hysterangium stoloniferum]|nr:hypothetical protein BU17DRAFT_65046 [Hysterangium stoloniferum]